MTKEVLVARKETVDLVAAKIKTLQDNREIFFPDNYVPENALKSAWLLIQETVNIDKKPVLQVCSTESVANSLFSMVVQGLNPDKKQCYFIAYGNKLGLMRSYFGSIHVAKMVDQSIEDVFGKVVYGDDEFEYEIKHGKEIVKKHIQKLANVDKGKIIGAYATILYKDGKELSTIMTMEQILQSWKQSQMKPIDEKGNIKPGSTHDKFTADMCERTVFNKVCKYVINGSDDSNIVAKYAKQFDSELKDIEVETEMIAEIEANANTEVLDVDIIVEAEPEEITTSRQNGEPIKHSNPAATQQKPVPAQQGSIPIDDKAGF